MPLLPSAQRGSRESVVSLRDKVIIEVGVNEGQPRAANPHVPFSPKEIAKDSRACYDAGAAVVHYHGRDPSTGAAMNSDPSLTIESQRLITEQTPLIAYPTYAAEVRVLGYYDIGKPAEQRYRHIVEGVRRGVRFEMGPVDLGAADANARWNAEKGEWLPSTGVLMNTGNDHRWLTSFCREHAIKMTFGAFDTAHLRNLRNLMDMGWVSDSPLVVKFFLRAKDATPQTLFFYKDRLRELFPETSICWSPLTYGGNQFPLNLQSLTLGGHVRIGIGDYHYAEWGCPANAALVERAVSMARAVGREPATPDEAREIMGMQKPIAATR